MKHDLSEPCNQCPFSTHDRAVHLPKERFDGILATNGVFPCHKSLIEDEDGELVSHKNEQACAGFLGYMTKKGECNQMMQIGIRLGILNKSKIRNASRCGTVVESVTENYL